jgi:hypothetical protein
MSTGRYHHPSVIWTIDDVLFFVLQPQRVLLRGQGYSLGAAGRGGAEVQQTARRPRQQHPEAPPVHRRSAAAGRDAQDGK